MNPRPASGSIVALVLVLLFAPALRAPEPTQPPGLAAPPSPARRFHTYSIVARDSNTAQMGVAAQSYGFPVGAVVPWAEPGVGAVATQAEADPAYGLLGLELMRAGKIAPLTLKGLLAADELRETRQIAMIDASGNVAAHTGSKTTDATGHLVGTDYSVQGNTLANDRVWLEMAKAFESATGDLAERMLVALEAGQKAGGDFRGMRSAVLIVVSGKRTGNWFELRPFNLRVDNAAQPLADLRRLVRLQRAMHHQAAGWQAGLAKDWKRFAEEYDAAEKLAAEDSEIILYRAISLANAGKFDEARC